VIVNKAAWGELGPDLQAIIEAAASAAAAETYADFTYHNIESYGPLLAESGVQARGFSDEIVAAMGEAWRAISAEMAAADPTTRRVVDSFDAFLKKAQPYAEAFDGRMLAMRRIVMAS
jgi:TRAP-type mannitol/chloroaromatic compound transport system substrate-binding protein